MFHNYLLLIIILNEEKYKLNLFINEKGLNKYNIIKDEKIIIKLEDIKEICNNEQQMCKISFSLLSENIHNESIIEITINTTEKKESDDSSDSDSSNDSDDSNGSDGSNNSNDINNSDNNYVLIITIIIIVFILVVIIIIFILKFKNKKKDNLNNEIDNIKSDTQEMIISDKDN